VIVILFYRGIHLSLSLGCKVLTKITNSTNDSNVESSFSLANCIVQTITFFSLH